MLSEICLLSRLPADVLHLNVADRLQDQASLSVVVVLSDERLATQRELTLMIE